MTIGFKIIGEKVRAKTYLDQLRKAQTDAQGANGTAIVAASHDGVTTGFDWGVFLQKTCRRYSLVPVGRAHV
ncbi:MAG: hypothetical protein HC794_06800 [Nitrospiraceae bacterium]|nr:hypothetical protein [Nitrospiraceae bacterium]